MITITIDINCQAIRAIIHLAILISVFMSLEINGAIDNQQKNKQNRNENLMNVKQKNCIIAKSHPNEKERRAF